MLDRGKLLLLFIMVKKKINKSKCNDWPPVILWDTSRGVPVNRFALLNQRRQPLYNKLY